MFDFVKNKHLKAYLLKRHAEPTVILCFVVLLESYLESSSEKKEMTKSEVEKVFNKRIRDFGINTFRRDYLKRQSGDPRNAIDENHSQSFYLRDDFLRGETRETFLRIIHEIKDFYKNRLNQGQRLIAEIKKVLDLDYRKKKDYISAFLKDDSHESIKGRNFEIITYALLKVYFGSFGFLLNRFSTTFANDAGMDLIGQQAVYQVTVNMNKKKFEEDIIKTPDIRRIIVYKEVVKGFDTSLFSNPLVSRVITLIDLESYLDNLSKYEYQDYLGKILETMKHELERELA